MTDPEGPVFVTFCRRCGAASLFPMDRLPVTRADLESLRASVAEACPDHGHTTAEEAREMLRKGEAVITPPVVEEIRELYGLRRPPRAS